MILNIEKPMPECVTDTMDKINFDNQGIRRCAMHVSEDDAFTYIHPESFDFCDVYGVCEFVQAFIDGNKLPVIVSRFSLSNNNRSFEQEAERQQGLIK